MANLDNYRVVTETAVHFGFDKDNLTKTAQEALDQLATDVPNAKGYIITVEGGTDSVGDADYNYALSERRADSVIQYLASKHSIPAHKIYLIGLGQGQASGVEQDPRWTRQEPSRGCSPDDQFGRQRNSGATAGSAPAPPSM